MWRCVDGYAIGTSHRATQTPCQDRCASTVFTAQDGGEVMVSVVSDGAGSAGRAEQGAQIVCDTLLSCALAALHQSSDLDLVEDEIVRSWLAEARDRIRSQAGDDESRIGDYNATGLLAIAAPQQTLCAQIGDGAIVVRANESAEWTVALWPEETQYANETFFVTDLAVAEHVQIARFDAVSDVVVFSDGLQRLALEQATRAAFPRFFSAMVNTVRAGSDRDSLRENLLAYLNSEAINARTDDDKSLAIACRIDAN